MMVDPDGIIRTPAMYQANLLDTMDLIIVMLSGLALDYLTQCR